MDGNRFDELARGFAGMRSRRSVLKAIGGAALGALAGVAGIDGAGANPPPKHCKYQGYTCKDNADCCTLNCCNRICCGDGQVCCNGQCHNACPSGQTLDSACQCAGAAPGCTSAVQCPQPSGQCEVAICLGGQCGFANASNGAACDDGDRCTTGDFCSNGVCLPGAAVVCTASDQCHVAGSCNSQTGVCSNPNAPDGADCSDGDACTTGDHCVSGVCVGAAVTCDAPTICQQSVACSPATGQCVAVNKPDGASCGADTACSADVCQAGQCVSVPKPLGTSCSDNDNCTQDDACDGNGACVSGAPVTCPPMDPCHGSGTCDEASGKCGPNPLLSGFCFIGGACYQAGDPAPGNSCKVCDPSQSTTGFSFAKVGTACDDGNACTTGDVCQANGVCAGTPVNCAPLDQCHLAGTCNPVTGDCINIDAPADTPCDDGDKCTTGDQCFDGMCTAGAPTTCPPNAIRDPATGLCGCAPGFTACPSGCVDTKSDPTNCGACGAACATGATCSSGSCACPAGQTPCGGTCVTQGNSCATGKPGVCAVGRTQCVNNELICVQNVLPTAEVCNGRDDDCDGVADNGNPGGGQPCTTGKLGICAAGTTQCQNGAIVCIQNQQPQPEVCNGLDDDCNGVADNGAICPSLPQAVTACVSGTCVIDHCSPGFANCDNNPSNGCEVNLVSDTNNCGTCGHQCTVANGTPMCANGQCVIASCNSGFGNCDGIYANGCEVNVLNDPSNCGACNFSCGAATPRCISGTCIP